MGATSVGELEKGLNVVGLLDAWARARWKTSGVGDASASVERLYPHTELVAELKTLHCQAVAAKRKVVTEERGVRFFPSICVETEHEFFG
jgi:hypothetical protein